MSGPPALLDSNVLVYALGPPEEPAKKRIAIDLVNRLMDAGHLHLSIQVLQEVYWTLTNKKRADPAVTADAVEALCEWPVFQTDKAAVLRAMRLSRESVISFWDALIVVAASRSGAKTVYTEDMNHGQEILGVRIVNPFLDAAE